MYLKKIKIHGNFYDFFLVILIDEDFKFWPLILYELLKFA